MLSISVRPQIRLRGCERFASGNYFFSTKIAQMRTNLFGEIDSHLSDDFDLNTQLLILKKN